MNIWSQTSISHVLVAFTADRQIYIFRGSDGFTFGGGWNWKNSSIVIAVTQFYKLQTMTIKSCCSRNTAENYLFTVSIFVEKIIKNVL